MSVYGYEKQTTPYLSRFATEAAVFERAFSTSAWTAPGMVSMFTGYYPPVHAQSGRFSFYDSEMTSALRVLSEHGYTIFGDSIQGPSHEDFGFERLTGELEDFVEAQALDDEPFFAWSHLRDVHLPYKPSESNAKRFGATFRTSEGVDAVRNYKLILRRPEDRQVDVEHAGKVTFTPDDVPEVRALYDGAVADVDLRLGRVLQRMRDTGLLDRTIVVISADHGEELFEHGWIGHASTGYDGKLYDELIRIPLIIRVPDRSFVGRSDALVQGVDVMPTLFELLGISDVKMRPPMQGHSLVPLIDGDASQVREFVFTQTTRKGWTTPREEIGVRVVSVRSPSHKLIWFPTRHGYRIEGFDLRDDPRERRNEYPEHAADFVDLEQALARWMRDNRVASSELVFVAAERRLDEIEALVLGIGDVTAAEAQELAIQTMEETWSLEPDSFLSHPPYRERWQTIRGRAAEMLSRARECHGRGGALQTRNPAQPGDTDEWVCVERNGL